MVGSKNFRATPPLHSRILVGLLCHETILGHSEGLYCIAENYAIVSVYMPALIVSSTHQDIFIAALLKMVHDDHILTVGAALTTFKFEGSAKVAEPQEENLFLLMLKDEFNT